MLSDLAKLAARSEQLRQAVIDKEAGVLGSVAKAAINHPAVAASVAAGGVSGVGKKREFKAGFDPEVQKLQLGEQK